MAKAFGDVAGRAIRSAAGRADSRSRMVFAVRAACKRLGIEDEDRHTIQLEVTGKASLSDMSLAEIGQVLDRLNKDWKGPMGHRAHVGKVRALWWTLYWLGAVEQPNDDAIGAFVERQTGRAKIQFLGNKEAFRVIEALKSWAAREGVRWPDQARLNALIHHSVDLTLPRLERHAVLDAIAAKLRQAGRLKAGYETYCQSALALGCNHWSWTEHQLDAGIRLLGKLLRRHLGRQGGGE